MVAQNEARILKNYHELIQEGRESFKKEVQSLMPEAKIGKKGKIFYKCTNYLNKFFSEKVEYIKSTRET